MNYGNTTTSKKRLERALAKFQLIEEETRAKGLIYSEPLKTWIAYSNAIIQDIDSITKRYNKARRELLQAQQQEERLKKV